VIFGLIFATFLTLVIVPIMFLLLTKVMYRFVPVVDLKTPQVDGHAFEVNGVKALGTEA
jgi:hypothetical protein